MLIFRLQFFISCLTAGSYLLTAFHLHYSSFVLKSRHCIGRVVHRPYNYDAIDRQWGRETRELSFVLCWCTCIFLLVCYINIAISYDLGTQRQLLVSEVNALFIKLMHKACSHALTHMIGTCWYWKHKGWEWVITLALTHYCLVTGNAFR